MTGANLPEVARQLHWLADRLALAADHYPSDVPLYVDLGIQVTQEAGGNNWRARLVDHLAEAIGAGPVEHRHQNYSRKRGSLVHPPVPPVCVTTYTARVQPADQVDPCAGGCTDPAAHAEGGHDA